MEIYYPYMNEYTNFMVFFNTMYEELYHQYHLYVEMDFERGGRVKLREDIDIAPLTRVALTHIIKAYYTPFDN